MVFTTLGDSHHLKLQEDAGEVGRPEGRLSSGDGSIPINLASDDG
jgi:hypothetical protein